MIIKFSVRSIQYISLAFVLINLMGCLTYKQIVNFQDGADLKGGRIDTIRNFMPLKVQPNDVLTINVSSYNVEEASKFNLVDTRNLARMGGNMGGIGAADPFGYRVDSKGFIEMPVVGRIYVKDLTIEQVRDEVYKTIMNVGYFKDLSIQIQFLTFRVVILGEVARPGPYLINNSKLTILEAIGLASDLTLFSNRDNVLIIREENGKREYGRVDFTSKDIFESPYYYLKPNDIIYVEPHKSKIYSTPDPFTRYVGTIAALLSLILLMISVFK